jgi:hypothetical protein
MRRGRQGVQRASRGSANGAFRISAAGRAAGNRACGVQLDIVRQVVREIYGRAGGQFGFQRILIGRRVNLAEVVDAGVLLGGGACFHEVGDGDGRQEADDGHDDHDFHQRETALADVFYCLHFSLFFLYAV